MHTKSLENMAKFLSLKELYETIQQKSLEAKEILWVCSPYLGLDAHKVFSQEILKNPPSDIRFVFRLNETSVRRGEVNPYEIQYFMEHFKGSSIKSHDAFHSKIYLFDNSALITSADLTKTAFESNIEVGVLLEDSQVDEVKNFFTQSLWETAKPIGDLKKFKQIWNRTQESVESSNLKKAKPHTKIKDWTDDYVNTWYIGVPYRISAKTERKIKKETNWRTGLSLVGDVGYRTFKQLKLGDLAYLANLNKKRGKIEIELARIFDKNRVETDEGDLHFAYETEHTYLLERPQFYEMLKNANISSRTFETVLDDGQIKNITNILFSIKRKRKKKTKT
jgi:hypothetical protein